MYNTVTEPETERMIKLRAVNEALFTGRKHTAKPAWRSVVTIGHITALQVISNGQEFKFIYLFVFAPTC